MALTGDKLVASNRKARRDFAMLETFEAGLVLRRRRGQEPAGRPRPAGRRLRPRPRRRMWLEGVHIAPYAFARGFGAHDPDRPRKLLLHAAEIEKIAGPGGAGAARPRARSSIYFRDGRAKVELALARGRRKGDYRHAMAERDAAGREAARVAGPPAQRHGVGPAPRSAGYA